MEKLILEQLVKLSNQMGEMKGELQTEMREGFRKVDERFEQIDERFKQVDERFEKMQVQIDERFEGIQIQIDEKVDRLDKKIDKLDKKLDDNIKGIANIFHDTWDSSRKDYDKIIRMIK